MHCVTVVSTSICDSFLFHLFLIYELSSYTPCKTLMTGSFIKPWYSLLIFRPKTNVRNKKYLQINRLKNIAIENIQIANNF